MWHWTSVLVVISGFDRDGPFEVDRIFGQSGSSKKAGGSRNALLVYCYSTWDIQRTTNISFTNQVHNERPVLIGTLPPLSPTMFKHVQLLSQARVGGGGPGAILPSLQLQSALAVPWEQTSGGRKAAGEAG